MGINVEPFPSVPVLAAELQCELPTGLVFLPDNFASLNADDDLLFRGEATTVTKVLRGAGLQIEKLGNPARSSAFIHNKSHDWALPIIFVGTELLKNQPDIISLTLTAIQDYVLGLFKGVTRDRKITASIVVEHRKNGKFIKVDYEGEPDGLDAFAKIVKRAINQ